MTGDDRASWTEYARQRGILRDVPAVVPPAPNKYHAEPVHVDGCRFASRKEAARYGELRTLEQAGAINALEVHPVYTLTVNGHHVGKYTADFRYVQAEAIVVEDVKSTATRTEAYRLRVKLMRAIHGVTIVEV